MNIALKPFQKQRMLELRRVAAMAQMNWQHFGQKQIISLTAPTGAGKTIMMASFIEAMMCGDEEGMMAPMPESIFIWLSDSPELNEQSRQKMIRFCDRLTITQLETLDEDFRGDKLEPGKIYFLNTQKLTKTSKMTSTGDGRDWTIWEVLENTIEEYGKHLVLIIDEAHRGAKTNQTTIMQKFVKGFETQDEKLQALPFIIGMSATPERFNSLAGASLSTLSKVVVTPKEVRDSGLLKDKIEIHFPEESVINKNIAVLQAAADEWKDKCLHWYNYTEKQHYQNVCPIFVVQVEPAVGDKISATDLDECVREIERRTGEHFVEGEVVHAFGDAGTIPINGIDVPYCSPSSINDDRKIKVVLFKEALSTGWDCPRAEAMMSYRVARDATYIAQLLGRMIRTPQRMRIEVDESLNYVHLYLPNFDENTVEEVVKKLTEEEGGALPTDVEAIRGGNKTSVVMTTKRPIAHVHLGNQSGSTLSTPSGTTIQQSVNQVQDAPGSESAKPQATTTQQPATVVRDDGEYQLSDGGNQSSEPNDKQPEMEMFVENGGTSTQESQDPYEAVKDAINNAEILTYEVKTVAVNKNYVRSLFEMARLGDMTGMDENSAAVDKVKDDIARLIHNYITELKTNGEYEALVDKALEFQLNTISVELYKSGSSYDVQQGPDLFSRTDAGLQHQYFNAEILLCGEGVGQRYADNYETDDYASMYDVILYVADGHQTDIRMDYAKEEFNRLADLYRPKSKNIPEKDRQRYNSMVTMGSTISKHLFHLPETINVDLDNEGETCTDHLFVNADGTATFNLKGWEPITLEEERKNPNFVCWLRNQDRKPWALCIPYDYGGETHRMFPDFLIIRKNEHGNYEYGLLEPHRDDKKDNLAKAKGLVKYVQECPNVDRVQMLRKMKTSSGEKMLRLELTRLSVQEKVMKCVEDSDFDKVFNAEGVYE